MVAPEAVAIPYPPLRVASSTAAPGGGGAAGYPIPRKLLTKLELGGATNGWVESMLASSPTHAKDSAAAAVAAAALDGNTSSWTVSCSQTQR